MTPPHRERGSATVELVLLAPVLLMLLWFLVCCGRLSDTRLQIEDAAHQAARAATHHHTRPGAAEAARTTAAAALDDAGITCQDLTVTTHDTPSNGTTATAEVTCTVGLQDLALLQVPGTTTLTARATAPVDRFRSRTPRFEDSEAHWGANRGAGGER
ncbi:pilus assembly protein [Streptomyces roseirectus]|uniref:Pilus assembly protein n=1 Tax=Streptomyces roseirectus TaxID=2768066 RepID=A0A7H0IQB5_9ACTN|nr:TadE/TadG family type IV pilus assembly protein [Streptomyces roseirectus]QNP74981.1 pilus assembly protein [Streptomyces roseirectus]